MPSSFTTRNRLTLQATGENINLWGQILNSGAFDLIDKAMDGVTTISASGPTTLTTANGADDQARSRVLNVTATGPAQITIPSVEKFYIVRAASADATITNGAASLTIKAGDCMGVVSDGVAIWPVRATDFAGQRLRNVGAPVAQSDAATKKFVEDTAFATQSGSFPGLEGNAGKVLAVRQDEAGPEWADPLPPREGNKGGALTVQNDGGVAWEQAVHVGDVLLTAGQVGGNYLPLDGASYPRADWPELEALMPPPYPTLSALLATSMPASSTWRSVAYGNGIFVAVADGSATAASSPDGVTWTTRSMPSSVGWRSVAYGNGIFVAVAAGTATAAVSTDGLSWTATTLPTADAWSSVAYGNGIFVAVADGSATAASSPDGVTWTTRSMPSSVGWRSVAYGNGIFVAVAAGTAQGAISSDGALWTATTLPVANMGVVKFGGGVFVALSAGTGTTAASSPDGVTWTTRSMPSSGTWLSLAYGGVFLALSSNSANAAFSLDGEVWISRLAPSSVNWQAIAFGQDTFVAIAASTANSAVANVTPSDISRFRVPDTKNPDDLRYYIKAES